MSAQNLFTHLDKCDDISEEKIQEYLLQCVKKNMNIINHEAPLLEDFSCEKLFEDIDTVDKAKTLLN